MKGNNLPLARGLTRPRPFADPQTDTILNVQGLTVVGVRRGEKYDILFAHKERLVSDERSFGNLSVRVTAPGCELHVYGMLWAQSTDNAAKMSVISPVKSLIFHESGIYRNLRVASPVTKTIVYERYAPNARTWSGNTTRLHPAVQLGDASHLNTTLDLSHWTTTFDDSAEGTLTFYAGTTVTVEIGDRNTGFGGYAHLWKTKPAGTVKFVRSESMARRGIHIVPDDVGIRFQTGVTIIIR